MSNNLITETGPSSIPHLNKVGCIITAAGDSHRMGSLDKIFAPINDKPLISYTIDTFQNYPDVHQIVLVLNKNNLDKGKALTDAMNWSKVTKICIGGQRRQDSVAEGLGCISGCQWIIIHDGARPCVTIKLIDTGLRQALDTGAAIAAIPAQETVKISDKDSFISSTPDRKHLWIAQTPQIFRLDIIAEAHRQAKISHREATDDAALVEAMGCKVKIYMGSYDNIKVTTPQDLILAKSILNKKGNHCHSIIPQSE